MKIYTRTGDDGTTGLIGKERVSKAEIRMDCIGTVDELNAAIGLAVVTAPEPVRGRLQVIQHELFTIGSHLATPDEEAYAEFLPAITDEMITRLELEIDHAETESGELRQFILPGGTEPAARLHLARAICRRAERLVVSLSASAVLNPQLTRYLNRLSDWLFMHARLANHACGTPDVAWRK